jgi:class 3 adenylate cyclase
MEPSEEIRNIVLRFISSMREGDEQAVSNRFSRQRGFERFGSDPAEWWRDGEEAALVTVHQMRQMGGGYPWKPASDVHALVEGTVGWAGVRMEFETPMGDAELRLTLVLHLEHGEWKIVHSHGSVPSTNEEHGFLLTTSVDEIVESVNATRPDLSATSAPDGTVTIAFTDIEDSTRLNAFLGDKRWYEILQVHNECVRLVTAQFGGTVVKNQGDGFMLAFPSSRTALRCAIALEEAISERFTDPGSPVRVRVGLHVGEATRELDDFFGHAVNYAARIASSAVGGEIVVSSLVHELLTQTGEFEFGTPRTVELKGLEGQHRVYPVVVAIGSNEPA